MEYVMFLIAGIFITLAVLERKIREVFELKGKKYKCVVGGSCGECVFDFKEENAMYHFCVEHAEVIGPCSRRIRTDKTTVNFIEVKK